jgi:hypothetical protein
VLQKALFVLRSNLQGDIMKSESSVRSGRLEEVMVIAQSEGLLRGDRTRLVRGRMPEALVARAKKRSGIDSDTKLIEAALASIAVADDYSDWLISRRGTIDSKTNLDY